MKRYVFRFLRKDARLSHSHPTEKARLPRFSLVLGIESCCEVDDLSCLGTLEKCRNLQDKVVDVLPRYVRVDSKFDSVINWKPV